MKLNFWALITGGLVGGVIGQLGLIRLDATGTMIVLGIIAALLVLMWTYTLEAKGKPGAHDQQQ